MSLVLGAESGAKFSTGDYELVTSAESGSLGGPRTGSTLNTLTTRHSGLPYDSQFLLIRSADRYAF